MCRQHSIIFSVFFLCICLLVPGCSPQTTNSDEIFTVSDTHFIDGNYTAYSKYYNPYGYGQVLTLEVHQGIITTANYQEIDRDGNIRTEKSDAVVRWSGSEESLSQICAELYSHLITRQSADIDTISGATVTSETFRLLAEAAIQNAQEGNTAPTSVNDFIWTYTAESAADPSTGYSDRLSISFNGDTITEVVYDEIQENSSRSPSGEKRLATEILTETTMTQQNLNTVPALADYPTLSETYNTLLAQLQMQRSVFTIN